MNPNELMNKLDHCLTALSKGNSQLKILGMKKAETEKIYRTALAKKMLKLRLEKIPVSMVHDLARGDEEVAILRLNRDIAESSYYSCKSAMDNYKVEIEVLRSKLAWLKVEFKNY